MSKQHENYQCPTNNDASNFTFLALLFAHVLSGELRMMRPAARQFDPDRNGPGMKLEFNTVHHNSGSDRNKLLPEMPPSLRIKC